MKKAPAGDPSVCSFSILTYKNYGTSHTKGKTRNIVSRIMGNNRFNMNLIIVLTTLNIWGCTGEGGYRKYEKDSYLPEPVFIPDLQKEGRGDPYYRSLSSEEYKEEMDEYSQYREEFGVTLTIENNRFIVSEVRQKSLGKKTGLRKGDIILSVNGKNITGKETGFNILDTIQKLQNVKMLVLRGGKKKTISIIRTKIFKPTIETEKFKDSIAYTKFKGFREHSAEEFARDKDIRGAKGLIIDLRGNGGGLLSTAVDLSSMFLKKGMTICYTKDFGSRDFKRIITSKDGIFFSKKIVLIVDQNTASASELFAQALKDNDRCTIIGNGHTYGKGVGQQIKKNHTGNYESRTTFEFFSPKLEQINNRGIYPDRLTENCLEEAINVTKHLIYGQTYKKKIRI